MTEWRAQLPEVRGRYVLDVPMSEQTWFRVGGAADVLYKPADLEDLIHFIKNRHPDTPLVAVGAGSNILVRDGGLRAVVIRLGRGFNEIQVDGTQIIVEAGALDRTVALTCAEHGLSGLEFLAGVPGTIGGAVKMNAGCYGTETKDRLLWAEILDLDGNLHRLTTEELGMTYRHSNLGDGQFVVRAAFQCIPSTPEEVSATVNKYLKEREASQPVRGRTGGSTFKNPNNGRAWELIDQAGCRGLKIGDAQVSELHCNFLLNTGQARAADLESLGEQVRDRVHTVTGVSLEWEIIRMGMYTHHD